MITLTELARELHKTADLLRTVTLYHVHSTYQRNPAIVTLTNELWIRNERDGDWRCGGIAILAFNNAIAGLYPLPHKEKDGTYLRLLKMLELNGGTADKTT